MAEDENIVKPKLIKDLGMLFPCSTSKRRTRFGLYECPICNKQYKTQTQLVKRGDSTKCKSCRSSTINKRHGKTKTRIHRIWTNMKQRCLNKNGRDYTKYGGRGIEICDEWISFERFMEWSYSNGYSDNLTIDRINNDGNYEPSNCRWTTKTVQSRNTKKIHKHNKSGYRGVIYLKKNDSWSASIRVNGKSIHILQSKNKLECAKAYDEYVVEHNLEHTKNFQHKEVA